MSSRLVSVSALLSVLLATGCYGTNANGGLGVDCSQQGNANAFGLSNYFGPADRERYSVAWFAQTNESMGRTRVSVFSAPADSFVVSFGSADGTPLTPGDYENAAFSDEVGRPFLGIRNAEWFLHVPTSGRFTIYEIAFNGSELRHIRASFYVEDRFGESSGCVRYTAP